jgi:hypothetical protein
MLKFQRGSSAWWTRYLLAALSLDGYTALAPTNQISMPWTTVSATKVHQMIHSHR